MGSEMCIRDRLTLKKEKGHIIFQDINETWLKIARKLPKFTKEICGKDLESTALKYADTMYIRDMKRAIMPLSHYDVRLACRNFLEYAGIRSK